MTTGRIVVRMRIASRPKRGEGLGTAVALVALTAVGFAQEQRSVPVFPARAEAITADVVVLDKDGRPVRGLTREDFTLLEDGRPQTIVAFEARELTSPGKDAPREGGRTDERVAENK